MVDIDGEITKCEKKLDLANLSADKIRKLLTSNIPETVRESNQEKVSLSSFQAFPEKGAHVLLYGIIAPCSGSRDRELASIQGDVPAAQVDPHPICRSRIPQE